MSKPTVKDFVTLWKEVEKCQEQLKYATAKIAVGYDRLKEMAETFNDVFYIMVDDYLVFRTERGQDVRVVKPGQE